MCGDGLLNLASDCTDVGVDGEGAEGEGVVAAVDVARRDFDLERDLARRRRRSHRGYVGDATGLRE
jgi:hypothetical protein